MTPATSTTAVPSARTAPTRPSKRACSRATWTPAASRSSLCERTRSASKRSDPNAFTTAIDDSASLASEAICPSWARRTRDCAFTRRRKAELISSISGNVAIEISPSTGSITITTTTIPNASSADCVTSPSCCENNVPTPSTSPVTRVTRSPFWRRWWKPSESRCRWS